MCALHSIEEVWRMGEDGKVTHTRAHTYTCMHARIYSYMYYVCVFEFVYICLWRKGYDRGGGSMCM